MIKNSKDLLIELIKTNFKLRYNNSLLGFIWVLIKPFAMFTILYFVWTAFRGDVGDNYQVKLLLGIILYTFVNEGIIFGMNGLLDKSHIILKVNFPREIAVLSSVAMAVINLSINLVVFGIFCAFNQISLTFQGVAVFFLLIVIFAAVIYGMSLFMSIILIKLRDLQHITELFFQLLFWGTPIFYELGEGSGMVGGRIGQLISLNPLGWLIQIARKLLISSDFSYILIYGREVSILLLIFALLVLSIILVISGRIFFTHQVRKVAEFF
jgi:ABC-2 type transport system permease protein